MRLAQLVPVLAIGLPMLVWVLWPLVRGGGRAPGSRPARVDDRRQELLEQKRAALTAIREIEFDHEAGHLADADYRELRDSYEARAALVLAELDALGPSAPPAAPAPAAAPGATPRSWTRSPVALAGGAALLVLFGLVLGLNIGRFTAPDPTVI
ncbi:MAG: hypothetical protein L0027_13335, partial [Candidatus Rokubacteria bacterium]|nr:hypothetical protein [Candidatus Rokubacteria bacterium]